MSPTDMSSASFSSLDALRRLNCITQAHRDVAKVLVLRSQYMPIRRDGDRGKTVVHRLTVALFKAAMKTMYLWRKIEGFDERAITEDMACDFQVADPSVCAPRPSTTTSPITPMSTMKCNFRETPSTDGMAGNPLHHRARATVHP